MKTDYKDKYNDHRSLNIELVRAGNYFGIRSNVGTLLVVLTNEEVARLAEDLNAWIESQRPPKDDYNGTNAYPDEN